MKKIKKVFGIIIFWGIGAWLFVTVSYLLRPVTEDFFRDRVTGFYAEKEDTLDIVTTGSSAMYAYFNNPYLWENYGLTSYNLTTPSQSVFIQEHLVDEIKKTQNPKLLIVETRQMILAEDKNRKAIRFPLLYDNLKYSWNRVKLINTLLDTWTERFQAYFDIYTYHDSWEEFSQNNLPYYDNEKSHELKGWINRSKVKKIEAPVIDEGTDTIAISEETEAAIVSFLEKCREEDLQVLFLATPWQISTKNQKKNRYLGELIESYGFQFLDCSLYFDEIGLDIEHDFYNKKHTNLTGSEKVTAFVGDYIMEHYDLSTEHSAEVAEDWNQMLVTYHTEADEMKSQILAK